MCSNGVTDMFEPVKWNFTEYSTSCKEQFDLIPRQEWLFLSNFQPKLNH